MSKYFDEIYPNATKLDSDFVKNETDIDIDNLNAKEQDILFNDYYINMCSAVASINYKLKTPKLIEDALNSDIKKYHWLKTMSVQLQFDMLNGRTGMIRGEDMNWLFAPDTINNLNVLEFIQRSPSLR